MGPAERLPRQLLPLVGKAQLPDDLDPAVALELADECAPELVHALVLVGEVSGPDPHPGGPPGAGSPAGKGGRRPDVVGGIGKPERPRIVRVGPGHDLEQDGGVPRVAGHHPHMVAGVAERDHPVEGHPPERRLHAGQPLRVAGPRDRTARLGAESRHGQPGGHGRRGTRGRASRTVALVAGTPGVARRRDQRPVAPGPPSREVAHLPLSRDEPPGRAHARHRRRLVVGAEPLEDERASLRQEIRGVEVVLRHEAHPPEGRAALVRGERLEPGDEGVAVRPVRICLVDSVQGLDPVEVGTDEIGGIQLARANEGDRLGHREGGGILHLPGQPGEPCVRNARRRTGASAETSGHAREDAARSRHRRHPRHPPEEPPARDALVLRTVSR